MSHSKHDNAPQYWDEISKTWHGSHVALWREQSDRVNTNLFERWIGSSTCNRLLKTDCFDELTGKGLYPSLSSCSKHVVIVDISASALSRVRRIHPSLLATTSDIRTLPFENGAFEVVLSLSTLDHFESLEQIWLALLELHRVLQRGGQLVLTMDNLANPIIALRNALPFELLKHLGLLPYFVGVSCRPRELRALVEDAGFEVNRMTAISHGPRMLMIQLAKVLERRLPSIVLERVADLWLAFEQMERLPTRFFTGHFIALEATRV